MERNNIRIEKIIVIWRRSRLFKNPRVLLVKYFKDRSPPRGIPNNKRVIKKGVGITRNPNSLKMQIENNPAPKESKNNETIIKYRVLDLFIFMPNLP
ncbi:MAG: hypothetical protein JSU92_07775 [Deltaproteobacteria bacterium]|nr:MAG: hypothetical protein JSU92_07775 [Deltaproteobacteria bacterium]